MNNGQPAHCSSESLKAFEKGYSVVGFWRTLNDEFNLAYAGKKDINTALRDADEKLNKYIAENPKK
ncbi:hypothetical protein FE784_25790 [Paenibacillus hemerocallicola]|uniref:Uncharacterized protein n=1 Tax=Paenibacillus hemerocallicola TaxID=1172614 RepID=A0A5C4T2P2_9BACL|nr:hypothetical protein FE784_25790 [Paenibacillus hemerocallicola]